MHIVYFDLRLLIYIHILTHTHPPRPLIPLLLLHPQLLPPLVAQPLPRGCRPRLSQPLNRRHHPPATAPLLLLLLKPREKGTLLRRVGMVAEPKGEEGGRGVARALGVVELVLGRGDLCVCKKSGWVSW